MSKAKPETKRTAAEKTPEQILCREIADVCKLLDIESLMFLKRQADVLLHNSRVDKLRREPPQEEPSAASPEGERDLTPPPRKPLPPPEAGIRLEQTTAATFNIYVGKTRVFFNRDEMRELTRICHAAGDSAEGGRRLFAWFRRERIDFLIDTDTGNQDNPVLAELADRIVHTYTVKE